MKQTICIFEGYFEQKIIVLYHIKFIVSFPLLQKGLAIRWKNVRDP